MISNSVQLLVMWICGMVIGMLLMFNIMRSNYDSKLKTAIMQHDEEFLRNAVEAKRKASKDAETHKRAARGIRKY